MMTLYFSSSIVQFAQFASGSTNPFSRAAIYATYAAVHEGPVERHCQPRAESSSGNRPAECPADDPETWHVACTPLNFDRAPSEGENAHPADISIKSSASNVAEADKN